MFEIKTSTYVVQHTIQTNNKKACEIASYSHYVTDEGFCIEEGGAPYHLVKARLKFEGSA